MKQECPTCPASGKGTPTLEIIKCPNCGEEMEAFSTDKKIVCKSCSFIIREEKEE